MNKEDEGTDLDKPFENCDASIISNVLLQILIAAGMLGTYIFVRRKVPWVYFPNAWRSPEHPGHRTDGRFNWIWPVLSLNDTTLLSIIGLDGFMFLQTVKLLYRICFILMLTALPVLGTMYYSANSSEANPNFFVLLSIPSVNPFYSTVASICITYFASFLIFYLIYIYYKRFVALRQLYLASPSSMTGIGRLKKLSLDLPENCTAMEYVDIKTRTVVMDRLPSRIRTDRACKDYLNRLRIGEIEDAVVIHKTYNLQKLYEAREKLVQNIEKEIHRIFWLMEKEYTERKDSFGTEAASTLLEEALSKEYSSPGLDKKVRMGNAFFAAAESYMASKGMSTTIPFHMRQFRENESAIIREREHLRQGAFDSERSTDPAASSPGTASEAIANPSMFIQTNLEEDVSFFSTSHILHPFRNRQLFSLDLPYNRPKAFVIFKDARTAAIALQSKIGTQIFSCSAVAAPSPYDVIWKNITRNEVFKYITNIFSMVAFIVINVLFLYAVTMISTFLKSPAIQTGPIAKFFIRYPRIFNLYKGVILPLVYNISLFFIPFIFTAILNLEGMYSYSMFQARMMRKFSYFLFFNGFLVYSLTETFVDIIKSIYNSTFSFQDVLNHVLRNGIVSSLFFTNVIVQRLFVGNAMVFLKPGPFLFNFFITPLIKKTRRQQRELEFSPPLDFGNAIPNALLILPMVLIYLCVSPILSVFGWLFYLLTYFTYKNELLFAGLHEYESGGIYWCVSAKFIIFTVILFQIMNTIRIYLDGYTLLMLSIAPLFLLSYLFFTEITGLFERSSSNYPLNEPEESYLNDFSSRAVGERARILSTWTVINVGETDDSLSLVESSKANTEYKKSFYRDPALAAGTCDLILPKGFYAVVEYLMQNDQEGIFGFKEA